MFNWVKNGALSARWLVSPNSLRYLGVGFQTLMNWGTDLATVFLLNNLGNLTTAPDGLASRAFFWYSKSSAANALHPSWGAF